MGVLDEDAFSPIFTAALRSAVQPDRSISRSNTITGDEELLLYQNSLQHQRDLPSASRLLEEFALQALQASQSRLLLHDPDLQTLTHLNDTAVDRDPDSTAAGLVGFVARTRETVVSPCLAEDPRSDVASDALGEDSSSRFLGLALAGTADAVVAVVVVVRSPSHDAFTTEDIGLLSKIALVSAPALMALLEQHKMRDAVSRELLSRAKAVDMFRAEALHEQALSPVDQGAVLSHMPDWLRISHLLLSICAVVGLLYVVLVRTPENAVGQAVVRARFRVNVNSSWQDSSRR